jgi:spore maturation protein CgeB
LGDRDIDVVFIGSILSGDGYHSRRKDFLEFLLNKGLNIEIYANVDNTSIAEVYKKRAVYLFSHFVERIGMEKLFANSLLYQKGMALNSWVRRNRLSRKMREKLRGSVFGMDMFKVLARSKICLNIHGDVVRGYAANMRIFEATGMGSLLVTENFANMKELFSENEVVLYDSFEQAYEKIVYLLDNEAELLTIARAGQQRTLEKHTYLQRAKLFLNKLEKFLS